MRHRPIGPDELSARTIAAAVSSRRFALAWLLAWIGAAIAVTVLRAHAIAADQFIDADDQLRLVEVRDWLGGQNFFDVTQYRFNQPWGSPMHWSRLVDMPLAAVELLCRPLLGPALAERAAAVAVPLATLGLMMLAVALIARRLAGDVAGMVAAFLAPLAGPAVIQALPMRVDHHGWEIVSALAALLAALAPDRRRGLVAGVALAVALQVSLEALPFTAVVAACFGLSWAVDPRRAHRDALLAFTVALAGGELLLFALLHAPAAWGRSACDAVSPAQLAALLAAAGGVGAAVALRPATPARRLAALAGAAALAALALRAIPPHCGLDPFVSLEPITRRLWLDSVGEGLPLWRNGADLSGAAISFPLVSLLCAAAAWRTAAPEDRARWARYLLMLAGSTAVAVLVLRASGVANAAAVPAAAWGVVQLVTRFRASTRPGVRVAGPALAVLALTPAATPVLAVALLAPPADRSVTPSQLPLQSCVAPASARALDALPPARFLAPIDTGPALLLFTHHAALASGYHRNHVAIAQAITAFTGSDATAHNIVRARGLRYVLVCPLAPDMLRYRTVAPDGFAAHLLARRAPAWLRAVAVPGTQARVWQVLG